MATELKPVAPCTLADVETRLTQYCGPVGNRKDDDPRRLQLTQGMKSVSVSKDQARALAVALLQWTMDDRPEASELDMLDAMQGNG